MRRSRETTLSPGMRRPATVDVAPGSGRRAGRRERSELRAGLLVFFADQFDVFLPVIVLASVGAYFQPASVDADTAAVLTAFVFASALITRPIGAMVFGHLADTAGRKRATELAVLGFGAATLLIALLPGSARVGVWSIVGLIALRSVSGVCIGGAYTASIPLVMERVPASRRGYVGGLLLAVSPVAYASLGLMAIGLHELLPDPGVGSAYARWGWRIPFLIGAALAFLALLRYRRSVAESTPVTGARRRSPLHEITVGPHRAALLQVLVMVSGVSLAANLTLAVLPAVLGPRVGLTAVEVAAVMTLVALAAAASFPAYGQLSQLVGRRTFYRWYGVVMVLVGAGAYAVLLEARPGLPVAALLAVVVGLAAIGTYGPIAAYLAERFPTEVRSSGWGVGYSLGLVVPGFYGLYLAGLAQVLPSHLAPSVLLVVAGVLVHVGATLGPETRDVDLRAGEGVAVTEPTGDRHDEP